ncbi:MAG: transposase [Chromatiaceae bacterium]|nr:transposase [Chromatiaceae bacterium]
MDQFRQPSSLTHGTRCVRLSRREAPARGSGFQPRASSDALADGGPLRVLAGVDARFSNLRAGFSRLKAASTGGARLAVRCAKVGAQPLLKHSRWTWLKDRSSWTTRQIIQFHHLSRLGLKTARAWRLKERLREILAEARTRSQAETLLNRWFVWARRCRLEPFKALAKTLRAHWNGLLNGFDSRLSNGRVEGMNAMIQAAKARARGYRTTPNLIAIAYLIGGKFHRLPASPYSTPAPLVA